MAPLITFRKFDNFVLAHIVRAKLEANGIHCLLKDATTFSAWGGAVGQIQLLIPEDECIAAEEIIKAEEKQLEEERKNLGFDEEDTEELDPQNHICIHCGSKNTRRKEDEKDSPFLSWLLSIFGQKGLNSEEWHCFHCGKDF